MFVAKAGSADVSDNFPSGPSASLAFAFDVSVTLTHNLVVVVFGFETLTLDQ